MITTLKQLALAHTMYAEDNAGHLPPKDAWMDAIYPYIKNEQAYHDHTIKGAWNERYGIAFYGPLDGVDIETVVNPRSVPLVFQSRLRYRNANSDLTTLPNPPRQYGKNFVAFLDMHVKAMPPEWPTKPIVLRIDAALKPKH